MRRMIEAGKMMDVREMDVRSREMMCKTKCKEVIIETSSLASSLLSANLIKEHGKSCKKIQAN